MVSVSVIAPLPPAQPGGGTMCPPGSTPYGGSGPRTEGAPGSAQEHQQNRRSRQDEAPAWDSRPRTATCSSHVDTGLSGVDAMFKERRTLPAREGAGAGWAGGATSPCPTPRGDGAQARCLPKRQTGHQVTCRLAPPRLGETVGRAQWWPPKRVPTLTSLPCDQDLSDK